MTRYLNFCREPKNPNEPKQKPHYEMYRESYRWYEAGRKDFRKDYNEAYRELKGDYIECECGSVIKELTLYSHRKTKKHLAHSFNLNPVEKSTAYCVNPATGS